MSTWTRPASVPLPTIWSTFQGKIVRNGMKTTYWIQDITDDYKDQILKYMLENFLVDEPLCKYGKVSEDSGAVNAFKQVWTDTINQNMGLVCLTKDDNGKIDIAGVNLTMVTTKEDEESAGDQLNTDLHPVLEVLEYTKHQVNIFTKLNITEYLYALGLYVRPEYHGEGIGLALLQARKPLCKAFGLKASLTVFSSIISQKLADRAGFKDLYAIDYDELERKVPRLRFPGIQEHSKSVRLMYILYD